MQNNISSITKKFHYILRCHSRSRSRSFSGITTSHSRSRNLGMEFPFPFPKFGNWFFNPVPVPKSWECNFSFPFPFPKFGNRLSHSRSRSQMSKSHSRSPLVVSQVGWDWGLERWQLVEHWCSWCMCGDWNTAPTAFAKEGRTIRGGEWSVIEINTSSF